MAMRAKGSVKPSANAPRRVRWEVEVIPWGVAIGLLAGFVAEIYGQKADILWMTGGALAGGIVGAICDTALFLYRLARRRRMKNGELMRKGQHKL